VKSIDEFKKYRIADSGAIREFDSLLRFISKSGEWCAI
jgi:hypothetical protein